MLKRDCLWFCGTFLFYLDAIKIPSEYVVFSKHENYSKTEIHHEICILNMPTLPALKQPYVSRKCLQ